MSKGKKVKVAFANMSPQWLELDVVSEWKPTKVSKTGTTVFFKVDDQFVSMEIGEYNKIFEL